MPASLHAGRLQPTQRPGRLGQAVLVGGGLGHGLAVDRADGGPGRLEAPAGHPLDPGLDGLAQRAVAHVRVGHARGLGRVGIGGLVAHVEHPAGIGQPRRSRATCRGRGSGLRCAHVHRRDHHLEQLAHPARARAGPAPRGRSWWRCWSRRRAGTWAAIVGQVLEHPGPQLGLQVGHGSRRRRLVRPACPPTSTSTASSRGCRITRRQGLEWGWRGRATASAAASADLRRSWWSGWGTAMRTMPARPKLAQSRTSTRWSIRARRRPGASTRTQLASVCRGLPAELGQGGSQTVPARRRCGPPSRAGRRCRAARAARPRPGC